MLFSYRSHAARTLAALARPEMLEPAATAEPQTQRSRRRQSKHEAILEAGQRLFLTHGFGECRMDDVAKAACVSKATLYAIFTSKADLFAAIVQREGTQHKAFALPTQVTRGAIENVLTDYGAHLLELLLSPGTIAAYRSIAMEASRSPELGRIFYSNGPQRILDHLQQFMAMAMRAGVLREAPPRVAAVQFVELIRGDLHTRCLMGVQREVTTAEKRDTNRQGVATFLRAFVPA